MSSKSRTNKPKSNEKFDASDKQSKHGSNPKMENPKQGPKGKGRNNANYWNKHADLVKSACSLPFAQALGAPLDWDAAGTIASAPINGDTESVESVPGIAALRIALTYGTANEKSSALNIAARNLYTFIRHLNSGHTNYDAPNLLIYFILFDQACALYSFLTRIYGTLFQYKVLNRFTPESLLYAQHVDPTGMDGKMAQMLFQLQQWSKQLYSFKVPSSIDVFQRHYEMFQYYYLDSENAEKAQVYVFYPHMIMSWDDVNQKFYSVLDNMDTINLPANSVALADYKTWDQLATAMNSILNALATTEDFNVMNGDIVKAYGDKVWSIPAPGAAYEATPVFNWEMLTQIHNATICECNKLRHTGTPTDAEKAFIANINTNFLPQEVMDAQNQISYLRIPMMEVIPNTIDDGPLTNFPAVIPNLLDLPFKDPTPDDVMVATRLTINHGLALSSAASQSGPGFFNLTISTIESCGSEIVTGMQVITRSFTHADRHAAFILAHTAEFHRIDQRPYDTFRNTINRYLWTFTLAPLVYRTYGGYQNPGDNHYTRVKIAGFVGDVDNHTIISPNTLDNMHFAAMMSAFNIPANATTA